MPVTIFPAPTTLYVPPGLLLGTYPVGLFPLQSFFDGTAIWVTNNYDKNNNNNTITKLTTNGEIVGTFVVGFNPAAIAFDGTNLWIANGGTGAGTIAKMSLSGALLASYAYSGNPIGICFDGTSIWITQFTSATVIKMNLSGVQQLSVGVGTGPCNVFFDGMSIWVSNNGLDGAHPANTVTKIRPSDGTVLGTFTVGNFPYGVCSDSSGNIYVAIGAVLGFIMQGTGSVVKLSPAGTVLGTFALSGNPYNLAYDGANIWATQYTGASVSVMSTGGAILSTYSVGTNPYGLCFDADKNAYVCNYLSNTVSKLAAYNTGPTATLNSFRSSILSYSDQRLTVNVVAPAIAAAHIGTALTTSNGTWWKDSGAYTYQWEISSTSQGGQTLPGGLFGFQSIVGQISNTYTPVSGDLGNYVRCAVTSGPAVAYSNQSVVQAASSAHQAASFDGISTYITAPQHAQYDFGTSDFTVSAWFYITEFAALDTAIVALGIGANSGGPYSGWALIFSNNVIHWYRYDGTQTDLTIASSLALNTWYNVIVYRKSGTIFGILNGSQVYTDGGANSAIAYNHVNSDALRFAQWQGGATAQLLTGYIEEVQLFNASPTVGDLAAIYNGGHGLYGPPSDMSSACVGLWHFSGSPNDFSTFGNNGTWTGTPAYVNGIIQ